MDFPALKYQQADYQLLSTVLPFRIINNKSKTLIYGKDPGGYQRTQDEKHYQNIRRYIETGNFVFPNSIILAVDESILEKITDGSGKLVSINLDDKKENIFRVVDGQHRLLGLQKASEANSSINNLELQVSIIITPNNRRSVEMEIFSNINSKAKRLKTDLIELAKYEFRILENNIGTKDLNAHIAINTAYNLNENSVYYNVWQNAIKIDIHSENKIGIIGVTAFSEAISNVVASYINIHQSKIKGIKDQDLIYFARKASDEIADFLITCWAIVKERWPKGFLEPHKVLDIDGEYRAIIYDPNYYLQKTLGCKAINYLIGDILRDEYNNKFNKESIEIFERVIGLSKLADHDWILGKTLSGISSESGFKKVTRIIKNEEPFIRKT